MSRENFQKISGYFITSLFVMSGSLYAVPGATTNPQNLTPQGQNNNGGMDPVIQQINMNRQNRNNELKMRLDRKKGELSTESSRVSDLQAQVDEARNSIEDPEPYIKKALASLDEGARTETLIKKYRGFFGSSNSGGFYHNLFGTAIRLARDPSDKELKKFVTAIMTRIKDGTELLQAVAQSDEEAKNKIKKEKSISVYGQELLASIQNRLRRASVKPTQAITAVRYFDNGKIQTDSKVADEEVDLTPPTHPTKTENNKG